MSGEGDWYECEVCHGSFQKTRSDEEALAEARALYPAEHVARPEDQGTVCDDCFRIVFAWLRANAPELLREEAR